MILQYISPYISRLSLLFAVLCVAFAFGGCGRTVPEGSWTLPLDGITVDQVQHTDAKAVVTFVPDVSDDMKGVALFEIYPILQSPAPKDITIDGDNEFISQIAAKVTVSADYVYDPEARTISLEFRDKSFWPAVFKEWITYTPRYATEAYAAKRDEVAEKVRGRYFDRVYSCVKAYLWALDGLTDVEISDNKITAKLDGKDVVMVKKTTTIDD